MKANELTLAGLRPIEGEATLKGNADILGVPHHVYLIEVTEAEDGCQVAVEDPYDRLEVVHALNEGRLQTVRVPGHAGAYVCLIAPHLD